MEGYPNNTMIYLKRFLSRYDLCCKNFDRSMTHFLALKDLGAKTRFFSSQKNVFHFHFRILDLDLKNCHELATENGLNKKKEKADELQML